jgi:hypothetical protein
VQIPIVGEVHYENIGSLCTILKAGKKVGYKYAALFFQFGPVDILGYNDTLLNMEGFFANLRVRYVSGPATILSC